jgi:DNA-binding GntR family transcriptional regulator
MLSEFIHEAPPRRRARRPVAVIERPKPLHESVVERLRNMIVEGDLAVGERLHDANLAATLQVSRTPIREAIKLLATEGLVDLLPGRGARVSDFSIDDIKQLFEAIAGIERNACELAAERMTNRDLEKVQRLHERMARHHAAGERPPYFKLNHEIHLAIVAASNNAILQAIHASLMTRARRARYAALSSQVRWIEAMAEHERLMAALADHDARRAGEIMHQHDLGTAHSIAASLRSTAPGSGAPLIANET